MPKPLLKIAVFFSLAGHLGGFPGTALATTAGSIGATGFGKNCSGLFISSSALNGPLPPLPAAMFVPTAAEFKKILLEEPDHKVGRRMNVVVDRVYVAIAKTDLPTKSSPEELALALVRLMDLQYELETGHDREQFLSIFSSYQPDMIQDSKSLLMKELRTRSFAVNRSSIVAKNQMQSWLYEAAQSFANPERLRARIDQNLMIAYGTHH